MRTSESIHLRPHDQLLREIDKFRRRKANPPSRPKAVEELVQKGLARQDGNTGNMWPRREKKGGVPNAHSQGHP